MSAISRVWVRNWSSEVSRRAAFFSVLCPVCRTTPSWLPIASKTVYSFVSSISFVFWFTTRTGSVKRVPPPWNAPLAAARSTWPCTRSSSDIAPPPLATGGPYHRWFHRGASAWDGP
jgi:hypothetical protein